MDKSPDAFRTISEVADWLGVPAHVLRFWESKFTHVKPVKRAGGRRYYRPADMALLGGIKKLLHDDGLTIKGVQKILREQGVVHVSSLSQLLGDHPELSEAATGPVPGEIGAVVIDAVVVEGPPAPIPLVVAEPAQDNTPPELIVDQVIPKAPTVAASVPISAPSPALPEDAEPLKVTEEAAEQHVKDPVVLKDEPKGEAPVLPSFLHRRAPPRSEAAPKAAQNTETAHVSNPTTETNAESISKMATDPALETAPVSEPSPAESSAESEDLAIRAHVVDAPDPPRAEDEIPYAPGPLAALSRIDALSAEQARQIAPLAKELQAWLKRPTGARPA